MMRRLMTSSLSTPRVAAALDAAQSSWFSASRGVLSESLAAWNSEQQMGGDAPLWRLDPRRSMSYRGQKPGTPNSSAKGREQQRKRQEEQNAAKAQKLLSQSPLVPDNIQATGTGGTPLKGWQPKGGMVAGHPVELPDIADDPTLKAPAKEQEPDHSVFDQLKALDPVFEAVALVPWLPNNEEGHRRRDYITASVLDKLEAKGWDVRGPVSRIWEGERDLERTLEGKDSGTRAALTAILYHVKKFDAELGDFREYAKRTE